MQRSHAGAQGDARHREGTELVAQVVVKAVIDRLRVRREWRDDQREGSEAASRTHRHLYGLRGKVLNITGAPMGGLGGLSPLPPKGVAWMA